MRSPERTPAGGAASTSLGEARSFSTRSATRAASFRRSSSASYRSANTIPVGADRPERTEARVIAATHRDLEALSERGQFRADLYHRLRVMEIRVPALRDRMATFPCSPRHLLRRASDTLHRSVPVLSDEALAALTSYEWPGNVRELENTLTRALVVARGDVIRAEHLTLASPGTMATAISHHLNRSSATRLSAYSPPLTATRRGRQRSSASRGHG